MEKSQRKPQVQILEEEKAKIDDEINDELENQEDIDDDS